MWEGNLNREGEGAKESKSHKYLFFFVPFAPSRLRGSIVFALLPPLPGRYRRGTIRLPPRECTAQHIGFRAVKGAGTMIETVVDSVRVSLMTDSRVVILKELEGERYLPIWIGKFEAEAIAMELQGVEAARPLPYDLLKTVIVDLGGEVRRVLVTAIRDDVFYATIVLEAAGRQFEIDARSSDAVALAVRAKAPIFVDEVVMTRAAVTFGDDEEETEGKSATTAKTTHDEKLSSFREFINSLDVGDDKDS